MNPDKCKVPFTAASGWGSYEQTQYEDHFIAKLNVAYGSLRLNKISLAPTLHITTAKVKLGGKIINGKLIKQDQTYHFEFENTIELKKGQVLQVNLS
jgi:hypothetical protein